MSRRATNPPSRIRRPKTGPDETSATRRERLTDALVARLQPAPRRYEVADVEQPGFAVRVGARRKVYVLKCDVWRLGKRRTVREVIGPSGDVTAREARAKARARIGELQSGEGAIAARGPTLREAWERYRDGHLMRRGRRERTIDSYRDNVER